MGADFQAVQFRGDKLEVAGAFQVYKEEESYEYGHHAYAGHLGITEGLHFEDNKHFDSRETAETWILEHQDKWSAPIAVQFGKDGDWLIGAWCSC